MTLEQYIKKLIKVMNSHPKAKDWVVIYASDEEGNNYDKVFYDPTPCLFDIEINQLEIDDNGEYNAVCIN